MASHTFSQKKFTPTAPEKGSFPLDHENTCKTFMVKYMSCLRKNQDNNSKCRDEAKDYLSCRMDNELMAKEDWNNLGFNSSSSSPKSSDPRHLNLRANRRPFNKRLDRGNNKPTKNIIIGCSGSVATIKLPLLIKLLLDSESPYKFVIKIVVTDRAKHFFDSKDIPLGIQIFNDEDEWKMWKKRGDPVLHIDLGKWADLFVIAPLDANSMAKLST
uniref:Flavoprotein domain-containing protein n=1 Tax=Megaselia scalaris TaxID=36166 RepID=T1GMG5_MEGSC